MKIAAIQMLSGPEVDDNLRSATTLLKTAADAGAQLAVLPENFAINHPDEMEKVRVAEDENGPIHQMLQQTAADLGLWICGGTLPARLAETGGDAASNRVLARSLLIDNEGKIVTHYDKIHLFDVDLPDKQESYRESDSIAAGSKMVVADTPFGKIGLSVCYDLRFPELYRSLTNNGAQILLVPAAFTETTGKAHWEILLRARAIENLAYVVAPNQGNNPKSSRRCWGHSAIIDPWGQVLSALGDESGVAVADLDLRRQNQLRMEFPCLDHRTE